jgi:hypothetical protein
MGAGSTGIFVGYAPGVAAGTCGNIGVTTPAGGALVGAAGRTRRGGNGAGGRFVTVGAAVPIGDAPG